MKSLALNLLKSLLLLLVLVVVATTSSSSAATATSSSSSSSSSSSPSSPKRSSHEYTVISATNRALPSTTSIPPSLQAPPQLQLRRHTLPATAATLKPLQMASRQRLPMARHTTTMTTTAIPPTTTNIMTNSKIKPIITETSTLASTRLVKHADATKSSSSAAVARTGTTPSVSANIRQHRSFQTNGAQPYDDAETKRKYTTLERRQYLRSSSAAATSTINTTGKTQPQQQLGMRQRTVNATPPPRPLYTSSNIHRQSKQQQSSLLPLDANNAGDDDDGNDASNHGKTKLTTLHNQQTPKTPRMIHRLVAGHIQNSEGHSTYQISSVTANSTVTNSTIPVKLSSVQYGQRRPAMLSSSYRNTKLNANIRIAATTPTITTTTSAKPFSDREDDYHDDDEALLDDPGDFDNWDNGILRLSAGSGKENNLKPKKEDTKKTLADQVRDGKYGLIEKELFRRTPKRPGVLSYLPNKEVPEDNERNFGGLNEEDIWLAEDHLLVIKGGSLNEDNPNEPWPAIDDYNVAGRQIKIPNNPKIPPPFPVQLEENGPVQLIGNNKLTVVYPVTNESLPVYTIGPQANNAQTENESDDEKNLITRPGSIKDAKENEPGTNYPSPSLPWLYNNQTFVNPSLNNAKPINFPILGPFLYGRNGSLDNINATDDFDEDDPSLYYPPAYTFVYKSNYTNPVPPGPLVPGIVVPPPPDHFSKLEKTEKERKPWSNTQTPPVRYRVYSTTTSIPVTSTWTPTTSTSTEQPYRQVVTKISEYTPKIINIVTPSPRPVYTPVQSSKLSPAPTTPPQPQPIEPIPVPVAVPIPIYSVNVGPSSRPNVVSFVPTTPEPNKETLSKTNPIYYEYFEAKRQKGATNVIDDFLSTTINPPQPSPKPIKLYATSKRPFKNQGHHRNYIQPLAPNHRYLDDSVVVITPKPELRYKPRPIFKQRPLQNFEQEVNAIRETLRYYQNQELRDNNIPRTPKAKPVFDYNYDASKAGIGAAEEDITNSFQPPSQFDGEPFKPMVTYSPSVNDENAFRALPLDKIDGVSGGGGVTDEQPQGREAIEEQPKYPTTTTLIPVQPQGRLKKLRIGAKYLQQPQQQQQQQQEYANPPRHSTWVAVNKQEFQDYDAPTQQRERYQESYAQPLPILSTRNRDFPGYYYGPGRQNNRFYEEPFQNTPNRKIVNYRPPPQQQQHIPQQWSLENDTNVNNDPNLPINPDAEWIDPYRQPPPPPQYNPYQQQRLNYKQHPALSHQSQYYAPPPLPPQRIPGRQYQPPPPPSLYGDTLVNYQTPLPPINPDSEYITHPNVVRNQPQQFYRSNTYQRLPQPGIGPLPINLGRGGGGNLGGEANVYYLTPKYRRANNLSNNNNSNRNYPQNSNNNGK